MTSKDGRDGPTTLTQILTQVAEGTLSVAEAEKLIRGGPPRPPSRRSKPLVVGLVFLVVGVALTAVGISLGQSNWSFAASADETEGTVVRMVASGRGSAPVVRYEVDGKRFEIQSGVSSSPPRYAAGDKVTVLYHNDEPHKGTIRSFMDQWLVTAIFAGIGSLFALIGLTLCLAGLRAVRPAPA